jgi:hypothetical protein
MIIENPENYRFVRFQVSETKGKKYDAILQNLETKKERRVPFGDRQYGQYEDRALGTYSRFDHKDKKRRLLYINRHMNDMNNKFSSGWFSRNYLW